MAASTTKKYGTPSSELPSLRCVQLHMTGLWTRHVSCCPDVDPEKEEMVRQLNLEYGGCVYVTRKMRNHEKEAAEAAAAAEAATACASNPGAQEEDAMKVGLMVGGFHPVKQLQSLAAVACIGSLGTLVSAGMAVVHCKLLSGADL
jgi:hypothetical protein